MNKTIMKWKRWPIVLTMVFLCCWACQENYSEVRYDSEDKLQIYDYIKSRPDLSTYRELLDYTGFSSQLSTSGAYTAFVPTNDAFDRLFGRLAEKGVHLSSIQDTSAAYWLNYIKYMTIDAGTALNSNTFQNGILDEPTMMGEDYYIVADVRRSYAAIRLNSLATITEYNVKLANGLIQIMDEVLLPPIENVYSMLAETGKFTKMLGLFDQYGLTDYLKDSTITLLVEPDEQLAGVDLDAIPDMGTWLMYHIFWPERYFSGELDGQAIYPLYREEAITFKMDEEGGLWCNTKFRFSRSEINGIDNVASNGVYHVLDTMLAIVEAPPGVKRWNLYAETKINSNGDLLYEQNVFTEAPAKITEDFGTQSFHQGKKPPIVGFDAQQIGDNFHTTITDVVRGKYTVRLLYKTGTRADLMMIYNDQIITPSMNMNSNIPNWQTWTYLQYKDCGVIDVEQRGDVTLYFQVVKLNRAPSGCCDMLMDMIELIPVND